MTIRWVLKEAGTYDICSRSIQMSVTIQYIDIFGPDPTAWVDWYVSNIDATITVPGSSQPLPPEGSVNETINAAPGDTIALTGSFTDVQGLSEITINNASLGINQSIPLAGELSYELNESFILANDVSDGDYSVDIVVTNIENLSTSYTSFGKCYNCSLYFRLYRLR